MTSILGSGGNLTEVIGPLQKKHWFPLTLSKPQAAIAVLFIAYCIVFTILSIQKYRAFNNDLDMGNMLQAFYSTLDGRFMEMTWCGGEENGCMWRGHVEIVFLLIFPFFALFPSAITLLILQTVAIASGGIAVYAIGRHLLRDNVTPVVLAVCYWLYPLLGSINLVDFHADSFMIAPHLFAWYFLRSGRRRLFWGAIGVGMLVKEHAFLFNMLLGTMLVITERKRGFSLFFLAAIQFFIMTPLVHFLAGHGDYHINLAQHVIGSPSMSPLQTIFAYATHFIHNLFSDQAAFVLIIGLTLNVSILLFPRGLIMLIPLMMIFIATGSVQSHRHAILIAPLFITLVEGVSRIPAGKQRLYSIVGIFVPVIIALVVFRDSLIGTNLRELVSPDFRNPFHYRYTKHDAIADSLVRTIPPHVPIAADAHLRTKLVNREWAFIHPSPHDSLRADYYLFDFFEKREYDNAWPERARVTNLLQSGCFSLAAHLDGLVLVKRTPSSGAERIPVLRRLNSAVSAPSSGYAIDGVSLQRIENGFAMNTRFHKGSTDTSLIHAFISFFIDQKSRDTLRVLHLASYTDCRLEALPAGSYEESFYFDGVPGANISTRYHEVWLYKKPGYLPFFSRQSYRIQCCWKSDTVCLNPK
jgi:uncharacterized membrane protein